MNLQILKESINAILPIKESDWLAVEPYLIEKSFEEGECFLKEKQVSEYIIFIYKGAIRSFYCNDELIETNLLLKSDGEFITEYESFVTRQPSRLSLQAIEKTEVVLVSRKIIDELYTTSFYWNQFGRIMSEYIFINSKKRTEELLFLSPEERYLKLLTEQPQFFQRYSLKHIASYLGITPQSLSRIRARISK